jgi:hypothetical protein
LLNWGGFAGWEGKLFFPILSVKKWGSSMNILFALTLRGIKQGKFKDAFSKKSYSPKWAIASFYHKNLKLFIGFMNDQRSLLH